MAQEILSSKDMLRKFRWDEGTEAFIGEICDKLEVKFCHTPKVDRYHIHAAEQLFNASGKERIFGHLQVHSDPETGLHSLSYGNTTQQGPGWNEAPCVWKVFSKVMSGREWFADEKIPGMKRKHILLEDVPKIADVLGQSLNGYRKG